VSSFLDELRASSHLAPANADFVEALYEDYLADPSSVSPEWRAWFDDLKNGGQADVRHAPVLERFQQLGRISGKAAFVSQSPAAQGSLHDAKQAGVLRLLNAYRVRGHQQAHLDPLELSERPPVPDLDPSFHGLDESDMDAVFNTGSLRAGSGEMRLRDMLKLVKRVYCGSIGAEHMHINDTNQRDWLHQRLEAPLGQFMFTPKERIQLLEQLTHAEGLEKYLHTRYVGQKRFSLEGGDSLIPLVHGMIQRVGDQGVKEVVLGMAHRGRLNVLVNILGKSPKLMFDEFEGKAEKSDPFHQGDVKYHMGFSSEMDTPGGIVHVAMGFNPSHLEIINPVVAGSSRARQTRRGDFGHTEVMPVLIHGDAAFAGQGVVMELFNMSQARGFQVGGTVHIIINNQIGFTTSNPLDTRSTLYCTEVAKMVQAPILHVNGDDPEAVMFAMHVASDFRMAFRKDVVIDLVCYRRHGHNEADEPAATQPVMYRKIRSMKTTRELYAEKLIHQGIIDEATARKMQDDYRDALDAGHPVAEIHDEGHYHNPYTIDWAPYVKGDWAEKVDTTVELERVQELAERLQQLPDGFELHPRVQRIYDDRKKMAEGELRMDWGFAETMAYATLLDEGLGLRLVGQDAGRGTFFHRHAVLHNQVDASVFTPLETLVKKPEGEFQPNHVCTIIDSLLSEEAVLGFEYGFASSDPKTLVIWEAQFGDFVNGAQVVIDQFISSGEAKWQRLSGLVLFLPHGYEGQGPEHSSARLERFMQLCARFNMSVCVPTTPAQMFHMLRRQMLRKSRLPLIVMTPKSLLRNKASTSVLRQLSDGRFRLVIPERKVEDESKPKRLVICCGKVYYDIVEERKKREITDIPIVRVEQLYPFPRPELIRQLERFPNVTEVVWCQEEPMNQGAWYQIRHHLQACLKPQHNLLYVGRPGVPSPAAGHYKDHLLEQQTLVDEALTLGKGVELVVE
jgi:2-oxoglutarate dehydrogenase E1 component